MDWNRGPYGRGGYSAGGYGGYSARGGYRAQRPPYSPRPVVASRTARPLPVSRGAIPRRALPLRATPVPVQTPSSSPTARAVPRAGLDGAFLYTQLERRATDLCHRYPRLFLPTDFLQMEAHWVNEPKSLEIPLTVTIPFRTDPDLTVPVPEGQPELSDTEPRTVARVMLLSMAKHEEPAADDKKAPPKPHPSRLIKFLVAKRANGGLMALGGPWHPTLDGGDPTKDETLRRTAIRHCKELCGVDLSPCTQWLKFVEIHYRRPNGRTDRTVIFVPDVWNHLAEGEVKVCKQVQQQETEVSEEVEVEVEVEPEAGTVVAEGEAKPAPQTKKIKKTVTTKKMVDTVIVRSMDLSLNGILEYDQQDKHEETTELSLFAEAFDEMLSLKSAGLVIEILKKKKVESDKKAEELKRKRDIEATERNAKLAKEREEREAKRKKLEEERKIEAERRKRQEEEEKHMTEEQIKERRTKEAEERKARQEEERKKREQEEKEKAEIEKQKAAALEEEKKKKAEEEAQKKTRTVIVTTTHVDPETLEPFSFFDKPAGTPPQPTGQLKRDRIEGILHSLGSLSRHQVEGLLQGVGLPREKSYASLYYKTLATTTTTTTKEVPIEEPKKEEEKKEEAADVEMKEETAAATGETTEQQPEEMEVETA